MPIKGPKGAIPTVKGWTHPKTGELLKSQKITQSQIDEWFGIDLIANPIEITEPPAQMGYFEDEPEAEEEDVVISEAMTKVELEELGREHGIELDRRKTKAKLIDELKGFLKR